MTEERTEPPAPRSFGHILRRAIRLRCPRCGKGKLFRGWFQMPERCSHCDVKYERAPGYFLGSAYINYGVTCVLLTVCYVGFHFGADVANKTLIGPLIALCLLFPVLFFRHARSLWIGMDYLFDPTGFEEEPTPSSDQA